MAYVCLKYSQEKYAVCVPKYFQHFLKSFISYLKYTINVLRLYFYFSYPFVVCLATADSSHLLVNN